MSIKKNKHQKTPRKQKPTHNKKKPNNAQDIDGPFLPFLVTVTIYILILNL